MSHEILEVPARWTNDCQGKKDYDGNIISLSTRYWPQGGGFHVSDGVQGFALSTDPAIQPSAHASILLRHGDPGEDGYDADYITITEAEFEGKSEAEVKAAVEAWAAARFREIAELLTNHYAF